MGRLLRVLMIIGMLVICSGVVCVAALFVLTEGEPVDAIQTALIRLELNNREDDLNRPMAADDSPIRFTINSGDTPRLIAANLVNAGLIGDADLFVDYVRVNDIDARLQAGTYFLNRTQNIRQVALAFTDPASTQFAFRILEGWRLEEIAEVIDSSPYFGFDGADFVAVVGAGAQQDPAFADYIGLPPGASLEGFLFPETYRLPADITPTMLRDILTAQFTEEVEAYNLAQAASAQGWTLYEAVTLASIIQREAVRADEHPRISSVYRNRLDVGMRLEADPTVQYGIGFQNDSWWPQITQADYSAAVSPYNTYLVEGLPPGPIASPGISAIRAAVEPEQTPFYFFRAACDGSGYHNFAVTFEEHLANACL